MSLKAMAVVWEDSHARGLNRLVLIAIADIGGDDGTGCIMRQEKIARKAGMSVRTLQRCIAELLADDELRVERGSTRTTNSYTVVVAWKRSLAEDGAARARIDERKSDTRQVGASDESRRFERPGTGPKDVVLEDESSRDAKLACVEDDQPDCGQKATGDNLGGSHAPSGGGSDPLFNRSLSPHARHDKLSSVSNRPQQGTIIPRGGNVAWSRQMDRQHANCHPEICNWRDTKVRQCMPLALVDTYARKLTALPADAAIANVIAWARGDAPPADYVASGDIYAHWRLRWDLTRATAPGSRAATRGEEQNRSVPGARETDALLDEMTGGRARA
jgi:hypothetical protein